MWFRCTAHTEIEHFAEKLCELDNILGISLLSWIGGSQGDTHIAAHKGTHIYLLVQESVSISQGEGNLQSLSRRTDFGADLDVVAEGSGNSGKTMPRRTHFT